MFARRIHMADCRHTIGFYTEIEDGNVVEGEISDPLRKSIETGATDFEAFAFCPKCGERLPELPAIEMLPPPHLKPGTLAHMLDSTVERQMIESLSNLTNLYAVFKRKP